MLGIVATGLACRRQVLYLCVRFRNCSPRDDMFVDKLSVSAGNIKGKRCCLALERIPTDADGSKCFPFLSPTNTKIWIFPLVKRYSWCRDYLEALYRSHVLLVQHRKAKEPDLQPL